MHVSKTYSSKFIKATVRDGFIIETDLDVFVSIDLISEENTSSHVSYYCDNKFQTYLGCQIEDVDLVSCHNQWVDLKIGEEKFHIHLIQSHDKLCDTPEIQRKPGSTYISTNPKEF